MKIHDKELCSHQLEGLPASIKGSSRGRELSVGAGGSSWPGALHVKPRKMPGFFFSHNNMTELNGKEDCKLAKGKVHKKKQKTFGADLKSYLKCMVPHIESGIKTSSSKNVMLSAEEVIQWSQSLEKLLASQSGQGVFREFLKSEFSEENIEFWLACEDYKKTNSDHLHGKAEKIYEEFVQSDAIKQINIDYQMREATAKKAQDPTHTSFDEAQKTVYILMERDSYPRFLKSKSYLNLLNQLQTNTSK